MEVLLLEEEVHAVFVHLALFHELEIELEHLGVVKIGFCLFAQVLVFV